MSRQRSASQLVRQLNRIEQPIYVLDESRRIIFCNSACAEWVGMESADIVGQVCFYHVGGVESEIPLQLTGLCPPPEVFAGKQKCSIASIAKADQQLHQRIVDCIPLVSRPSDSQAVLCVVRDLQPTQASQEEAIAGVAEQSESELLRDRIRQHRNALKSRYSEESLLGDSPVIRRIRSQIAMAAQSDQTVLVIGPSGSGRQHVANVIHYRSNAAAGSLVPLACGFLASDLLISTVEAVVRKSQSRHDGAPTNTLLLTDVDQLSADVQPELLRILNSATGIRVLATSASDLLRTTETNEFRRDLAYWLSTLVIEVPALHERKEDIPILAQAMVETFNLKSNRQLRGFAPEALDRLASYSWPGNVAQLAEVVRQSHAKAQGYEIAIGDLPERMRAVASVQRSGRRRDEPIILEEFLAKIEKELLTRALTRSRGNKTKAATMLGMTRPRFYRRLVQLGLAEANESEGDA